MSLKINKSDIALDLNLIENGTTMNVVDAYGDQKFLNGDEKLPMKVVVRSTRSKAGKDLAMRLQKRNAKMNAGRRNADVQIPNEEFIARHAAAATVELINFDAEATSQRASEEEFYAVFKDVEMEGLAEQIYEHAKEDRNYVPKAGEPIPKNVSSEAADKTQSPTSES